MDDYYINWVYLKRTHRKQDLDLTQMSLTPDEMVSDIYQNDCS